MNTQEILDRFDVTVAKVRETLAKKNHDYTQGSIDDALNNFKISSVVLHIDPSKGLLVRVLDKIARLVTFIECGRLVVDNESATDSIHDIIGYMALLEALLQDESRPGTL